MALAPSVVDGRVLLLGLDQMYRGRMKRHEAGELRRCAQRVAEVLSLSPGLSAGEGYYTETAELEEYFTLMRTLQQAPLSLRRRVATLPEFQRLMEVVTSPIFGTPLDQGLLLPTSADPLYWALKHTDPRDYSVLGITRRAHEEVLARGDRSFVGLAALIEDPVVLAALRESLVLYAAVPTMSADLSGPEYVWNVSDDLSERAGLFVKTFNNLFAESLPEPVPENAELFYEACDPGEILGRCARIAYDDSRRPPEHYHWAVYRNRSRELVVEDFWDADLWTTDRYRRERAAKLW